MNKSPSTHTVEGTYDGIPPILSAFYLRGSKSGNFITGCGTTSANFDCAFPFRTENEALDFLNFLSRTDLLFRFQPEPFHLLTIAGITKKAQQ